MTVHTKTVPDGVKLLPLATAMPLPRRIPGAALAMAGDEFVQQLAPTIGGPAACFECERHPARLLLTVTETGWLGGTSSRTFKVCEHCACQVAVSLADDVTVVITRLRKDPTA